MPHLPITRLLLKLHSQLFKPLTRLLDVVDRDSDVSKAAAGLRVPAGVALEVGVGFGAMVVCELEDPCKPGM
jgi:hypothetical protein